jgi:hypothetical protein
MELVLVGAATFWSCGTVLIAGLCAAAARGDRTVVDASRG